MYFVKAVRGIYWSIGISKLQKETTMKIALVTGGSRGLGKNLSLHIAAREMMSS